MCGDGGVASGSPCVRRKLKLGFWQAQRGIYLKPPLLGEDSSIRDRMIITSHSGSWQDKGLKSEPGITSYNTPWGGFSERGVTIDRLKKRPKTTGKKNGFCRHRFKRRRGPPSIKGSYTERVRVEAKQEQG